MKAMSYKTIIGGRKVLLDKSWLLPDGENISVEFEDEEGDSINIRIEVLSSEDRNNKNEKNKASLSIHDEGEVAVITFTNWNQAFGNSTGVPVVFAKSSDEKIELSFLASIAKISSLYRVEFQVMSEVKK